MARILVIDDNPRNLDVLSELLDQHNFVVLFALDGRSGLERAETGRPDLILLDVMMSGIDGFETCRQLKRSEQTKEIPVIFMTALNDTPNKVKAFECGAVDYITKPFEPDEVLARIHTHLTLQQLRRELQQKNEQLQRSLDTLHKTQEQLVESQKMAALGRLVAGIAHEINTPVGTGITAASFFERKSQEVSELYDSGRLARSQFEAYLHLGFDCATTILTNLQRVARLIQSFKQVAIDRNTEDRYQIHLKTYLSTLFTSLRTQYAPFRPQLLFTCPDDLSVTISPDILGQILSNLVENSLLHGFRQHESGTINLDIRQRTHTLIFTYQDNGQGMTEEQRKKVFDPFFTTRRAQGGVGLGMHIVYNLVTQTLGGTIECHSTPEQGTTFLITLPLLS